MQPFRQLDSYQGLMIRWMLLLLACASAVLGCFSVPKLPDLVSWTAAVLAGEFGYMVAIVPALTLFSSLFTNGFRATLTFWLSLAALVLLVQPCVQAWWIGRSLPERLRAAYGDPARRPRAAEPFSIAALLESGPAPVAAKLIEFSPNLRGDFYAAVDRAGLAPAVIVIHGGGWNTGERGDIKSLDYELARAGYAIFDISYRLAPNVGPGSEAANAGSTRAVWPAQRNDVLAAIRYVKTHAAELGIDRHRLVVLGRSAGGQIAEATAYAINDPDIRGVVGLYAPADMLFAYQYGREDDALKSPSLLRGFLGGPPSAVKANYVDASSYLIANPRVPPTLLIHGKLDTLVWYRQSERLTDRLAGFGVKHLLVSLPWATHAVEYHSKGPSGQLATYSIEWFLGAVTR